MRIQKHGLFLVANCALVANLFLSAGLTAQEAQQVAAAPGDWPCWQGPNHDNRSLDKGLLKEWPENGPKQLWKISNLGRGYSSVAVSGGKIYVTGGEKDKGFLFALDGDGKQLWKVECGRRHTKDFSSLPTVDGNNVYTLDPHGLLICHDAETGKKKWSREARAFGGGHHEHGYTEAPLIFGDTVIFSPGGKNCIVALDKATGNEVWKSSGFADGVMYSSCISYVFNNEPMIVTGTGGGLRCVKAKTGELVWKNGSAVAPWSCPTPVYGDGYVFWANGYGKGGVCMKLQPDGTAKEAWTTKTMDCMSGGYVIDNGYVYGNHGVGWVCLDLKTGKKMWNERGVGKGSVCWADGMLYLFSENGGEAALATCSPEGFKITGKLRVAGNGESWAHPVVTGGRLYLRYGNNLYCFDVKGA